MPRILFTHHAVDRFIERWAPGTPIDEARAYLEERAASATRLRTKTALGQAQYELDDPRCVLVVKRRDSNDVLTCVTILPKPETFGAITEHEEELMREVMARIPPPVLAPVEKIVERQTKETAKKVAAIAARKLPVAPKAPKSGKNSAAFEAQQAAYEAARTKDLDSVKRHVAHVEMDNAQMKRILRGTVRYFLTRIHEGDERARAFVEALQALEPGFVTEGFVNGDRREVAS